MARVLSISSQVVWGPVGNTAAVPALQSQGHEVLQVPTVLLSNHPGHGKPEGQVTSPEMFQALLDRVKALGALQTCDAVLTGYFATASQVRFTARLIAEIKPAMVLVDPVLGDHGRLYVPEDIAAAIRDHLVPIATMTTPNVFELSWLTTRGITDREQAISAARVLPCPEVLVTSTPMPPDHLATLLVSADTVLAATVRHLPHVPHGTGDYLAGLYLGARLQMPQAEAFNEATSRLEQAIARSAGQSVLSTVQPLR